MTFGVPYSFVPGTKAKADEVNANFIDVLTKIEDTNSRIDSTNTDVESVDFKLDNKVEEIYSSLENRIDLDFSNISEVAQAKFDAKANKTDLDGNWVSKSLALSDTVTFSNKEETSFSLADYLPNDGALYEVKFYVAGNASNNAQFNYTMGFCWEQLIFINASNFSANHIGLANSTRTLRITPTTVASGTNKFCITLRAYRKVR